MTNADRIAKARRDQAIQREHQQAAKTAEAAARRHEGLLKEISRLVPQTLRMLANRKYPDAQIIRVKRIIGSTERAAWIVASRQVWDRDSYRTFHCYLLSTGDFVDFGGWSPKSGCTPRHASYITAQAGHDPQAIAEGLKALLKKYGH
jgi:hypothetical protein